MIIQSSPTPYKFILTGSADLYQGSYALYFQSLFSTSLPSEFSIPLPISEQVRNRRRENNCTTRQVYKTGHSLNQKEQDTMLTCTRIQSIPLVLGHKQTLGFPCCHTSPTHQPQIMLSMSQENYLSYFKNAKAEGLSTPKHQEVTS